MTVTDEMAGVEAAAINEQIEAYTESDGSRSCSRCHRSLRDGDFMVSLMGRGLRCPDAAKCIEAAVVVLNDSKLDLVVPCDLCGRDLRDRDFEVSESRSRIWCSDRECCM